MANTLDPLKIGDSLVWNLQYKQSDNTPIDLTGSLIDIDAINKSDKSILFNITSQGNDTNSYLTVDAINGAFQVVVKDTSHFKAGDYDVDIEFTDSMGFKKSSKSFILSVVSRYK